MKNDWGKRIGRFWYIDTKVADNYILPYIDWNNVNDLGKVPDVELSKKFGVSSTNIMYVRQRRNISALNPTRKLKIDWDLQPLGKMCDEHLADILGCSTSLVNRNRTRRGIKPHGMTYKACNGKGAYYSEMIVDTWFHAIGIEHEFQVKIGKYRVDFLLQGNKICEVLGLWNHRIYGENYKQKYLVKKSYFESNGYIVESIYPKDLVYLKTIIDTKLIISRGDFICPGCKESKKHHAKGFCSKCVNMLQPDGTIRKPKYIVRDKNKPFICVDCKSSDSYK